MHQKNNSKCIKASHWSGEMVSWQGNAVEVQDCDLSAETIDTDIVRDNGIDCWNPAVGREGHNRLEEQRRLRQVYLSGNNHGISTLESLYWNNVLAMITILRFFSSESLARSFPLLVVYVLTINPLTDSSLTGGRCPFTRVNEAGGLKTLGHRQVCPFPPSALIMS